MVVGTNPTIGLATLVVIFVAWIFGLSRLASLIGVHVVTPLHLLLFVPFVEFGVYLFHTRSLPMNRRELLRLGHHPWRLLNEIWLWEWHALVIWSVLAVIAMPLLAKYLRRFLVIFLRRHRALMHSRPAMH